MAVSIDGILADPHGVGLAGSALLLASPSPVSIMLSFDAWEVELAEGSRWIVARGAKIVTPGANANDYRDSLRTALARSLNALDHLSCKGIADLMTTNTSDTHIVWWPGTNGPVVRTCHTQPIGLQMSFTATVLDSQGNPVPPSTPPRPQWHPSMRLYRLSQLAEQVDDAIRNLWLATENILEDLEAWKPSDNESDWLRRALNTAHTIIDLSSILPPARRQDPAEAAYLYFYEELRRSLFHAKNSRLAIMPGEFDDPLDLASRHRRLTMLYLALLGEMTGVTRGFGTTTSLYAFNRMVDALIQPGATLSFTDDPSTVDEDSSVNPAGGKVVTARLKPGPRSQSPEKVVYLAKAKDLGGMQILRRLAITHDDAVVALATVDGVLSIEGADQVQAQYALRLRGFGGPRTFTAP